MPQYAPWVQESLDKKSDARRLQAELAQEEARRITQLGLLREAEKQKIAEEERRKKDAIDTQLDKEGDLRRARTSDLLGQTNPITGQPYTMSEATAKAGMNVMDARLPELYKALEGSIQGNVHLQSAPELAQGGVENEMAAIQARRAELMRNTLDNEVAAKAAQGKMGQAEALSSQEVANQLEKLQAENPYLKPLTQSKAESDIAFNKAAANNPDMKTPGYNSALSKLAEIQARQDKVNAETDRIRKQTEGISEQNELFKKFGGQIGAPESSIKPPASLRYDLKGNPTAQTSAVITNSPGVTAPTAVNNPPAPAGAARVVTPLSTLGGLTMQDYLNKRNQGLY